MTPHDLFLIRELLKCGVHSIHLRKPDANISEHRKLLENLIPEQRKKIIIHNYPELYAEYSLKGIHINKNVLSPPTNYNGFKTLSCHSLEEVKQHKNDFDYLFLSRIFDSIFIPGLQSQFSHEELLEASVNGIIDSKVIALGGVTFDKLAYLKKLNFGGAAMIESIYNLKGLQWLQNNARFNLI